MQDGKTGYNPSSGVTQLRDILAEVAGAERGLDFNRGNVIIQPGGKPVIPKFIQALMNPGDGVLYPNPGYPIYESQIDFYGGIGGELANGISWDVGALYYWYPGVKAADDAGGDFDFYDIYAGVGYTFGGDLAPSIGFGIAYTPDYFGEVGDATYYTVDFGLALPGDIGLAFQFGYQDNDEENRAGPSYSCLLYTSPSPRYRF